MTRPARPDDLDPAKRGRSAAEGDDRAAAADRLESREATTADLDRGVSRRATPDEDPHSAMIKERRDARRSTEEGRDGPTRVMRSR